MTRKFADQPAVPRNWGRLSLEHSKTDSLQPNPRNPRRHNRQHIRAIASSLRRFGLNAPIIINPRQQILAGHAIWQAAKLVGLEEVPTIVVSHLQEAEELLYMIAANRLGDLSSFDDAALATLFLELDNLEVDLEDSGFSTAEIDLLIEGLSNSSEEDPGSLELDPGPPVTRLGDQWHLGRHRICCGDATDLATMGSLMAGKKAAMATVDMPYNVRISGHVSGNGRVRHREFLVASGEMSSPQYMGFLKSATAQLVEHTVDGSLHYLFIDWRHIEELQTACRGIYSGLINICVWVKNGPGLGSPYRSQHELILVLKNGKARHRNNVQLGKFGRDRSNVWQFPNANTFSRTSEEGNLLQQHPTPKPVALIADAILDATARGAIVLDTFLGSGTTVIAAERTGRCAYGLELDPIYVDLIIRRWQNYVGEPARHAISGKTFDEIARERVAVCGAQ